MTYDGNYEIDIIPWFSRDEWNEAYKNIFGNSADGWKFAFNKILVWKARVPKLPVGIESTIPLLLAQMALCDPTLYSSFKNIIIDWAIARFVTMATKGHYAAGTTMHDLAYKINMPQYLVDFRNQTSHTYSTFGISHTLQTALKISLQWIKVSYWDEEAKKLEELVNSAVGENDQENDTAVDLDTSSGCDERNVIFTKNIVKLNKVTFKDTKLVSIQDKAVKPTKAAVKSGSIPCKTQMEVTCRTMQTFIRKNRIDCINTLVKELFYSDKMKNLIAKPVSKKMKNCWKCVIVIPPQLLHHLSPIVEMVLNFRATDLFFEALFDNCEDCPNLCSQWIRSFVNSFFLLKKGGCGYHQFQFRDSNRFLTSVRWKKLLFRLFSVGLPWSVSLAQQLAVAINLDEKKLSELNELHSLYSLSADSTSSPEKKDVSDDGQMQSGFDDAGSSSSVRDLDNLLIEARKISTGVHSYVEQLGLGTLDKNSSIQGYRKRKLYEDIPLGLLPHQIGDETFYHQLRLTSHLSKGPSV